MLRWRRAPSNPLSSVLLKIGLLASLLFGFPLLGIASYLAPELIRMQYPNADALALIHGSMLHLVLGLTVVRFLFRFVRAEQLEPYLTLPVSRNGLLRAQVLLSLVSPYTLLALVLVVPFWTAEMGVASTTLGALAWLASALLLTVVVPALGMQGLNLLMRYRPKIGGVGLLLGVGALWLDTAAGSNLVATVSQLIFGIPVAGLGCTAVLVSGILFMHLRAMRVRLHTDRLPPRQNEARSGWSQVVYQWLKKRGPAGRLVALDLRQTVRTRGVRGLLLVVCLVVSVSGVLIAIDTGALATGVFAFTNVGVLAFGIGIGAFRVFSGYADGLLARPHSLRAVVKNRLAVLGLWLLPGTIGMLCMLPWISPGLASFLLALALPFSYGIVVPALVYLGAKTRIPFNTNAPYLASWGDPSGHKAELSFKVLFPGMLASAIGVGIARVLESWWIVSGAFAGLGLLGLLSLPWVVHATTSQFVRHRHTMLEGFRTNEPA